MGKRNALIIAGLLIITAVACGGSDEILPTSTLVPTAAVLVEPSTVTVEPSKTENPPPVETTDPLPTDTAAPTNTVANTATSEPEHTDTAAPPTETSSPVPTATIPPPTNTPLPTLPPATNTLVPTSEPPTPTPMPSPTTAPLPSPTAEPVVGGQIVIISVDKRAEYVDLQNVGDQAQDISGWVLISEKGDQRCSLGGVIEASAILRVWALASDSGQGGFNCGFGRNIWNNSEPDPAALYDNSGNLVDRFP